MPNSLYQSKTEDNAKMAKSSDRLWDLAIAEAKRRIKNLQFSIKVFEQHRQRGEPWIGMSEEETQQVLDGLKPVSK